MTTARGTTRTLVVDGDLAVVDGSLVTLHAPEALRHDPYACAVHAVWREAAQTGAPVRAQAFDAAGRTSLVVHPDGTVVAGRDRAGRRAPAARHRVRGAAGLVVAAVVGLATALALGGRDRDHQAAPPPHDAATSPTASVATSGPAPRPAPASLPAVAAPQPPPPTRRAQVRVTTSATTLRVVITSTRRPVAAVVTVVRPDGTLARRKVSLTTVSTEVDVAVGAGPHTWSVRVEGVVPITGEAVVPTPAPPPPEPAPEPAPDPVEQPPPSPPAPPADDPPAPSGGGGGGNDHPPPGPLDGGPPPGPV